MLDSEVNHDKITRQLSANLYTSKDLWVWVKQIVRQFELDYGRLIFDDTVQEKAFNDKNEIIFWHFDHCKGRTV